MGIDCIKEAVSKYSPGVVIPNVPSTPAPLRGRKFEGKLILEVPAQVNPIPQSETFAKFLFLQQPKPKNRFSAVFSPNHS